MSDEEDYMSDKFLQGTEKYIPSSLIYRHADKRELELMKKKAEIEARLKEKNQSMKYIEQEKREEGLSSAITSSNKGFEMLMKMGYKPGQGIGKTESGRTEPISVEVKADRQGLGKAVKSKGVKNKIVDDKLNNKNMTDFRDRIAQKKSEQLLKADLYKSQKICEQLDTHLSIETPKEAWFWLPKIKENDGDNDEDESDNSSTEEEDESLPISEKLEILTKYLREKHFYCIWCGVAFNDEDDIRDSCPGNTRNDH